MSGLMKFAMITNLLNLLLILDAPEKVAAWVGQIIQIIKGETK